MVEERGVVFYNYPLLVIKGRPTKFLTHTVLNNDKGATLVGEILCVFRLSFEKRSERRKSSECNCKLDNGGWVGEKRSTKGVNKDHHISHKKWGKYHHIFPSIFIDVPQKMPLSFIFESSLDFKRCRSVYMQIEYTISI